MSANNNPEKAKPAPLTGLALLREPFPAHQVSKLPKPTRAQTDAVKADFKNGIRCKICGTWHHPDVVHLDYVGHAALTDRLLDADPHWAWEPVAFGLNGLPGTDRAGGMWIRLTVDGVTRLGYGHAGDKTGGDAVKEVIGDALRNAAMRFGAALDLWHKGDLHADEPGEDDKPKAGDPPPPPEPTRQARNISAAVQAAGVALNLCNSEAALTKWAADNASTIESLSDDDRAAVKDHYRVRLGRMKEYGLARLC